MKARFLRWARADVFGPRRFAQGGVSSVHRLIVRRLPMARIVAGG